MTRLSRAIHALAVIALALSCLMAAHCTYRPGPTPGTGGTVATGGTSQATGGSSYDVAGSAGVAGAAPMSQCQLVCAAYARFGCPEDQSTCAAQCQALTSDTRFRFDIDCRINATSRAAIQACGIGSCK